MDTIPSPGDTLPPVEHFVSQERVERYADASGDFNPIHIDHEFAATTQFGRTISHGMMIAATISEMMTLAFPESWPATGRLKLRFRAPVFPEETVKTLGEVKSVKRSGHDSTVTCKVEVRKPDGQAAITGDATITVTF